MAETTNDPPPPPPPRAQTSYGTQANVAQVHEYALEEFIFLGV